MDRTRCLAKNGSRSFASNTRPADRDSRPAVFFKESESYGTSLPPRHDSIMPGRFCPNVGGTALQHRGGNGEDIFLKVRMFLLRADECADADRHFE